MGNSHPEGWRLKVTGSTGQLDSDVVMIHVSQDVKHAAYRYVCYVPSVTYQYVCYVKQSVTYTNQHTHCLQL